MKTLNQIIKDFLYENGIKQSELARKIGDSHQNFSQKLRLTDLTITFVAQICIALHHDFFADYANEIGLYKNVPKLYKQSPETIDIVNELREEFKAEFKALKEEIRSDKEKIEDLKKSRKISNAKH